MIRWKEHSIKLCVNYINRIVKIKMNQYTIMMTFIIPEFVIIGVF